MANTREKNGKKPPIENKKGIVIAIPLIIIDPDEVEVPNPKRPRVYKPAKEDTGKIYGRMADSIISSNNNSDDGSDGFIIKR